MYLCVTAYFHSYCYGVTTLYLRMHGFGADFFVIFPASLLAFFDRWGTSWHSMRALLTAPCTHPGGARCNGWT